MNKKLIPLLAVPLLLLAGCFSTFKSGGKEVLLSEEQIAKAISSAKAPQQFGFSVYPIGNGIAMQGNARLHPLHTAEAKFVSKSGPVIKVRGSAPRIKAKALIDTAAAHSWFEFSTAQEFRNSFLGYDGRMINYQGIANIGGAEAYAAVIPQLRIEQLFMENVPVYVRMARNSLGPLSRGIEDAPVDCLLGYDLLRNFEYIRFELENRTVSFSSTTTYEPNEALLVGKAYIQSVPNVGLAVRGAINGGETPILLDFAGRYDFAVSDTYRNTPNVVEMGEVVFANPLTIRGATQDGLPRVGVETLRRYVVTICPRIGVIYFERPAW